MSIQCVHCRWTGSVVDDLGWIVEHGRCPVCGKSYKRITQEREDMIEDVRKLNTMDNVNG